MGQLIGRPHVTYRKIPNCEACQIWVYFYMARSYDRMFLSFICKMGTKVALAT